MSPSCGAGLLAQRGLQIFKHSCKKILKGLCFLFKNLTPNHFSSRSALQEFLPVNILLTLLFYGMNSPILKQIELRKFQSLNHLSSLSPERHAEWWHIETLDKIRQYGHYAFLTKFSKDLKTNPVSLQATDLALGCWCIIHGVAHPMEVVKSG